MQYVDPRTGDVVETGSYDALLGQLGLTATDLEALSRLAKAEVSPIVGRNPNDLFGSIAQMMDVVQNRATTPNSPLGTGIQGVINEPYQFSPINGLKSWTGLANTPTAYDTAVSTYAGLQHYGAPNFVSQEDNFYHNPNKEAYPNDIKPANIQAREDSFAKPTTIGTGVQQHISGFSEAGWLQKPQPYSISLPDDYNISLNRDLTLAPLSYLDDPAIDPVGLGLHPDFMTGVPATEITPDPAYNAFAQPLGQMAPAFTAEYQDLTQDAPDMWGGIGSLPGMALDAVKAPLEGLYDMFTSPPEAPQDLTGALGLAQNYGLGSVPADFSAPPGPEVTGSTDMGLPPAPPAGLMSEFAGYPQDAPPLSMRGFAPTAPLAVPPGVNLTMVDTIPTPPETFGPPAPTLSQRLDASFASPEFTKALIERSMTPLDIPDAPDFGAPPAPPATPPEYVGYAGTQVPDVPSRFDLGMPPVSAPEESLPDFDEQALFSGRTVLGMSPEDFVRNVPGIGLTGTPLAGMPSLAGQAPVNLSGLAGTQMPSPTGSIDLGLPPEPPGLMPGVPVQPVEQAPLAPIAPPEPLDAYPVAPVERQPLGAPPSSPVDISARLAQAASMLPENYVAQEEAYPAQPVERTPLGAPPAPPDLTGALGIGQNFGLASAQPDFGMPPGPEVPSSQDIGLPALPAPPTDTLNTLGMGQNFVGTVQPNFAAPAPPQMPDIPGSIDLGLPPAPPSLPAPTPVAAQPFPASPVTEIAPTTVPTLAPAPAPELAPPQVQAQTVTPVAAPNVDDAFNAAPQAPLSVPVEGPTSLLNNAAPTPGQLATAVQTLRDQMPAPAIAAPLDTAPPQVAAATPTTMTDATALAPAPSSLPAVANAIAANTATALPDFTPGTLPTLGMAPVAPAPAPAPLDFSPPAPSVPNIPSVAALPSPPALDAPVGPLPGAPAPQAPQAPQAPPSPPAPDMGPTVIDSGYQVGTPTFYGGPPTINPAGDTAPKAYGPDYGGPFGINTGQYSSPDFSSQFGAAMQSIGDALGIGPAPSAPEGSFDLGGGTDTDMGGADIGGGDIGGDVGGDGGGTDTDTDTGGSIGGEQDYTGGGFGPDDIDDHGW